MAPPRLRQPISDFGSVGLADLKVIQAAAADQGVVARANGEMSGLAVLLGGLGDTSEKCFGVGLGVREGNTERAVVDVTVIEMLDERTLVRGAELG